MLIEKHIELYIDRVKYKNELQQLIYNRKRKNEKLYCCETLKHHFGSCGFIFLILCPLKGQLKLGYPIC